MNNMQKNFKKKARGLADGGLPARGQRMRTHMADGGGLKRQPHGGEIEGPGGPTDDEAGVYALSDDEYVLPADTVEAMGGAEALDQVRDATHTFVDEQNRPDGIRGLANGQPQRKNTFDQADMNRMEALAGGVGTGSNAARQRLAFPTGPAGAGQFTDAQRTASVAPQPISAADAAVRRAAFNANDPMRAPITPGGTTTRMDGPLNPGTQRRIDAFNSRPAPVPPSYVPGGMSTPAAAPAAAAAATPRPPPEPGKMNYIKHQFGRAGDALGRMRPGASATAGAPAPAPAGLAPGAARPGFVRSVVGAIPGADASGKAIAGTAKGALSVGTGTAKLAGRVAGPLAVANEASRLAYMYNDPEASAQDMWGQGLRSGVKLLGGSVGGVLGAAGGSAGGPVGTVVGGVAGATAGYALMDKILPGEDYDSYLDRVMEDVSPADRARAAADKLRGAQGPAALPGAAAANGRPVAKGDMSIPLTQESIDGVRAATAAQRTPYVPGAGLPSAEQIASDKERARVSQAASDNALGISAAGATLPQGLRPGANGISIEGLEASRRVVDGDALQREQERMVTQRVNERYEQIGGGSNIHLQGRENFSAKDAPWVRNRVEEEFSPGLMNAVNKGIRAQRHTPESIATDNARLASDGLGNIAKTLGANGRVTYSDNGTPNPFLSSKFSDGQTGVQRMAAYQAGNAATEQDGRDRAARENLAQLQAAALSGNKEAALILTQQGKDASDERIATEKASSDERIAGAKTLADGRKATQDQANSDRTFGLAQRTSENSRSAELRAAGKQRRDEISDKMAGVFGPKFGKDNVLNSDYAEFDAAVAAKLLGKTVDGKKTGRPKTIDDISDQQYEKWMQDFKAYKEDNPGYVRSAIDYLSSNYVAPTNDLDDMAVMPDSFEPGFFNDTHRTMDGRLRYPKNNTLQGGRRAQTKADK